MILAVDGTNLAHRAWHAVGANTQAATELVNNWLYRAAKVAQAGEAVVCFDGANAGSWRYELLPGYKSGRSVKPPAFTDYVNKLPQHVEGYGWTVFTSPDHEADDALAAVVSVNRGINEVTVCTGDKDAYSLAVSALLIKPGQWELLDEQKVQELAGVNLSRYDFYCAVKGDASDKIPGVQGLGPKAAAALAGEFASAQEFATDLLGDASRVVNALGAPATKRLLARKDEVAHSVLLCASVIATREPDNVTHGPVPPWHWPAAHN
jgi:DNA polymerase-1